jgi:hypothetical protein
MPSTVYKGDLTEISFGHEAAVKLPTHFDESFVFLVQAEDASADTTTVRLTGTGSGTAPIHNGQLSFPIGMLVGSELTFSDLGTSQNFNEDDNFATSGRRYTIVKNEIGSNYTDITITPKMLSGTSAATTDFGNGTLHIHAFKTPAMDVDMGWHTNANASSESVATDQFMGLINTISLPETKVDLKRYHVIGLGRDVAVQVPGRFTNVGGSFETTMHSARWLYYGLGEETVSFTPDGSAPSFTTASATSIGETLITTSTDLTSPVGKYVYIQDDTTVPIHLYKEISTSVTVTAGSFITGNSYKIVSAGNTSFTSIGAADNNVNTIFTATGAGSGTGTALERRHYGAAGVGAEDLVTNTQSKEMRRIVAYYQNSTTSVNYIWLDEGLNYVHASGKTVKMVDYSAAAAANSTPVLDNSTKAITNPVNRMLYSKSTVPSFAMEVSIRRTDNQEEDDTTTEVVDGGASDSQQLTRVFKGCKVKEFSMVADTDAAVRLNVGFDAALCYTDTGRLEASNKGDRFDVHRIFEDTADTVAKRREAGIGKGTQKPFMFYNGQIQLGGVTLGQVISFDLKGKTGVEQYYTISGNRMADAATDQVPFAGARNASLAVEGKTEYELDMEIIVDNPTLFHQMRRAVRNFDNANKMVRLSFVKQGTAAASGRESMDIVIDDYFITEASLPLPDDQAPIKSTLKILPKSIRVFAQDTIFHY